MTFFFNQDNTTIIDNSNKYRLSIVYYKSKKLFQKVPYTCSIEESTYCKKYYSEIGGSIVSVVVNTFSNSVLEKESNVIDYDIKYSKVSLSFLLYFHRN